MEPRKVTGLYECIALLLLSCRSIHRLYYGTEIGYFERTVVFMILTILVDIIMAMLCLWIISWFAKKIIKNIRDGLGL